MELRRGQSWLLIPLLVLLTCVQPRMGLEYISYVPQLSGATLAGKVTQSTFTLAQPQGQFDGHNISNFNPIWLVVARGNATQKFTAPPRVEDSVAPARFSQNGFYLTLRASRAHYPSGPAGNQVRVLRVGNSTSCSPTKVGCNPPLPGSGPYRVKFLVMSDKGPVAETDWSNELHLQQAQAFQAIPGTQSPGTVVIITMLTVLLAILAAVLLILSIHTCFDRCRSAPISGPGEQVPVTNYNVHRMQSPAAREDL
ncbi:uroplakin-3b-like protein 1 [Castor canadensis]|uniref:Uroplakin-3b-like protein n=1 Tax=Castor canadensis TaxID=51338 RepID=A0A8B7TY46_CASCN|nr:uroplakin-3b-like protein [Castor canadensis]